MKFQSVENDVKKQESRWNFQTPFIDCIFPLPHPKNQIPWPITLLSFRLINLVICMFVLLNQYPAWEDMVIANQLENIMRHPTALSSIHYPFTCLFHYFFNCSQMGFCRWLAYCRLCITIRKQYVENIVYLESSWQIKCVSNLIDNLTYYI